MQKTVRYCLLVLCTTGFLVNGFFAVTNIYDHYNGMDSYELIREKMKIFNPEEISTGSQSDLVVDKEGRQQLNTLPVIAEEKLTQQNPDYEAWLYLPDTKIDYPVVAPSNNTDYLKRTFDGKKHACGCLFFDAEAQPFSSKNTVIHGHNMKAGDMFGGLKQYLNQTYADMHKNLYIYRTGSWTKYQLYSVYVISDQDEFPYRTTFDENNKYSEYAKRVHAKSLIKNTKTDAADGLLTLSTCYGKTQKLIVQWTPETSNPERM